MAIAASAAMLRCRKGKDAGKASRYFPGELGLHYIVDTATRVT